MPIDLPLPLDGRDARERRMAALTSAEERFPEVARRFTEAYGMPLPRHLIYGAAFFLGLSREERELCPVSLGGFAKWFVWLAAGEPERVATMDARLEFRFRSDPPEFVTIAMGDSDGSHWGLYYDDPSELPALVAHGWARDDGVVRPAGKTLLACIRSNVSERGSLDADDKRRVRAMVAWLDALRELETRARADEGTGSGGLERERDRVELAHGGVGAHVPGFAMPKDLPRAYDRWQAYVAEAPEVTTWIARATADLEKGQGGLALVLGLELHHADRDSTRADCTRLLSGAYEALGRFPLAEIVRVHHTHRDLRSVGVYAVAGDVASEPAVEWVPPPVLVAIGDLDPDALETALEAAPTTIDLSLAASAVAERFQHRDASEKEIALGMLARLLEVGGEEVASEALASHMIYLRRCVDPGQLVRVSSRRDATQTRELIAVLLAPNDRRTVDCILAHGGRMHRKHEIEFAVSTGDLELVTLALESPHDVTSILGCYDGPEGMVEGATLLHFAVCSGSVAVVELLLSRGLDPDTKDGAGRTPRQLAKMLWFVKPNEANRMAELFDATKATPAAAPHPPSFSAGAIVAHKKFGSGTIEKVDGVGDEAKVTVRFGSETKTLQRKFLSLESQGAASEG